jgi:hypothetical protein
VLGGQLRDRARVVRRESTGERVEGGYVKSVEYGPWFRCFYDTGDESETRGEGSVRRRRSGAQLVTGRRALDGTPIELKAQDEVEVDSRTHGTLRLDVTGTPERMAKGRTWIGWLAPMGKTNRQAPG